MGIPLTVQAGILLVAISWLAYTFWYKNRPYAGIPIACFDGLSPKQSFLQRGDQLIQEGLKKYPGPFQVITGTGPKIVLQNKYADELRNRPELSFKEAFKKEFFANYPGFEPFQFGLRHDNLIQDTVRVKLTQSLNLITDDLVDETTASLHDVMGESTEWRPVVLKQVALDIVARLSSRVFLGLPLCRDERWLEITKSYTVDSFTTAYLLRAKSALFRPFTHWFLPSAKTLRRAVQDAHRLIDPEVERRKAIVRKAHAAGEKPPKLADTIGWMYDVAKGKDVDFVSGQLSLSMAAIHTTSETTSSTIFLCCEYPEVADQLREEIIRVIGEHGWSKNTLYKLRLMDSFFKEVQRIQPLAKTSMNRWVTKEFKLSDGFTLPKNSRLMVATNYMDSVTYPEPEKFDPARFLKMREKPGQDGMWQVVSTTPEHLLFGHGKHACPGRFFATNEIKILLCHLLLKYDWRFADDKEQKFQRRENTLAVNPNLKVEIRRRKEELDLDLNVLQD